MSTIAEHLAELEMIDANRNEGISGAMAQAGYMFLIVHYAEMIQERDPAEMAQARTAVERRLREQHPEKAEAHIREWVAARPALRSPTPSAGDDAVMLQTASSLLRQMNMAQMASEVDAVSQRLASPAARSQGEIAAMLDYLLEWFQRGGKLAELFPEGHSRIYTKEQRYEAIRAAMQEGS